MSHNYILLNPTLQSQQPQNNNTNITILNQNYYQKQLNIFIYIFPILSQFLNIYMVKTYRHFILYSFLVVLI